MKNIFRISTVVIAFGFISLFSRSAAAYTNDEMGLSLEAFGVSFGLAVYNSQMVIGLSADSQEAYLYSDDQIKQFVDEQLASLDVLRETVIKVQNAGIASSEANVLADMIVTIDKVKETANALKGYLANPTIDNAEYFHMKREDSYHSIAQLLGIKTE